jgi:TRAP-type C4-dicarboxylate transport system substrate-binding protein
MRKNRLVLLLVVALLLVPALLAGCGETATTTTATTAAPATDTTATTAAPTGESVTIKVVSFLAETNTMNDGLWMLQELVEEKSGGRLTIEWGGGPEAIPSFQLAEALRSGVVEMAWTAHTFNVAQIPAVEGAKLTRLTPWEERETGVSDFYNELYEANLNAVYLGSGTPGLTYNLYTTVPIETVADFQGKTMRVTPAYKAFVEALGAAPVTTDPGEVFTALERNLVVGYGWPSVGISDFGWNEVTKFVVEPAFYQVDVCALINKSVWDNMPEDLQDILVEAMQEVERMAFDHFANEIKEDRAALLAGGIQEAALDGAEAEGYIELAYESGWAEVIGKAGDTGTQLRSLIDR